MTSPSVELLRFETNQGSGDDTAANGLRMIFCKLADWNAQKERKFDRLWGDWMGLKMCPENFLVDGFQIRIEKKQGDGDDTALNGLKIQCTHPNYVRVCCTDCV